MYKYVKFQKMNFSLHLNPFKLVFFLFFKAKPLDFIYNPRNIKKTAKNILNSLWIIFLFFKNKYFGSNDQKDSSRLILLNINGDLLVKVRSGFKAINFEEGEVIKVFSDAVPLSIRRQEIDNVCAVSSYNFTPAVKEVSPSLLSYKEEYINGKRIDFDNDWNKWLNNIDHYILPLIEEFISISPGTEHVESYLDRKYNKVFNKLNTNNILEREKVNQINKFLYHAMHELKKMSGIHMAQNQMYLVFSHGDFSQKHVLNINKADYKVIDWETLGYRSVLFDFYNCFFQKFNINMEPKMQNKLIKKINDALGRLQRNLLKSNNETIINLSHEIVSKKIFYRKMYYFERICRILELQNLDDEMIDVILNWIDKFNKYETLSERL